eukprot:1184384-Amphidinium_carterae.1
MQALHAATGELANVPPRSIETVSIWRTVSVLLGGRWGSLIRAFKQVATTDHYGGVYMAEPGLDDPEEQKTHLTCYECGRLCTGLAGLKSHMRLAHGIASTLPRYVRSTQCAICSAQLASRALCLSHVRRTPACMDLFFAEGEPMNDDEYAACLKCPTLLLPSEYTPPVSGKKRLLDGRLCSTELVPIHLTSDLL